MKKKKRSGGESKLGFNFFLNWGYRGIRISANILIVLVIILLLFFILREKSFFALIPEIFRIPGRGDFLAILGGVVIFIAIPFLFGIRVGLSLAKK